MRAEATCRRICERAVRVPQARGWAANSSATTWPLSVSQTYVYLAKLPQETRLLTIHLPGLRIRRRKRPPRDLRAPRPCHSCLPGQGPRDRPCQGLCFRLLRRPHRCCSGVRARGWLRFRPLDPESRVCEEGRREAQISCDVERCLRYDMEGLAGVLKRHSAWLFRRKVFTLYDF